MRLIDADKIDFGKVFIGASDFAKDMREAAKMLVDEQPTAYDVDKVVEQLGEQAICPWPFNRPFIYLDIAEEIAKSGIKE